MAGVVALVVACVAWAFGGVASAQDPYTPNTQAVIMSSTTTPFAGQTIEASGKTYFPDEDVKLYIGGIFVGTAHTDAGGNFDPPVVVPAQLRGDQELSGIGASGKPNDQDSLVLHIRVRAGVGGTTTTSPGGPAFTGVQVAGLTVLAAVLLAGGAFVTTAARRRKSGVHS